MSVFVDTNVLIYAHDVEAGERHDRARLLVRELWQRPDRAAVSASGALR